MKEVPREDIKEKGVKWTSVYIIRDVWRNAFANMALNRERNTKELENINSALANGQFSQRAEKWFIWRHAYTFWKHSPRSNFNVNERIHDIYAPTRTNFVV